MTLSQNSKKHFQVAWELFGSVFRNNFFADDERGGLHVSAIEPKRGDVMTLTHTLLAILVRNAFQIQCKNKQIRIYIYIYIYIKKALTLDTLSHLVFLFTAS